MDIKLGFYSFSKFGLTLIVVLLSKFSSSIAIIMSASVSSVSSEIKTVFLNSEIPENEQVFCSSTPARGDATAYQKGLFGAHQSGSIWAKTFRALMHKHYPQYVEAGNERCVFVMREPKELTHRGLKSEKDKNFLKIVITIMNTDDMLIAYSDSARELVDSFEKRLNDSNEVTPCFRDRTLHGHARTLR